MLDAIFAIGLLLTTASQLRFGSSPLGPGELCLTLWILCMLGREAARAGPPLTPAFSRMLGFWTAFTLAEGIGTITGLAIGERYDPQWFLHDVFAYPLLAGMSCLALAQPGARGRLRRTAWLLAGFGAAALSIQIAVAFHLISVPMISPWYWERFRGWSDNPNQLAFLCAFLGLITVYLGETASSLCGRVLAWAALVPCVWVGRLTGSDTFTAVLLLSGPIYLVFKLWLWTRDPAPGHPFRAKLAWIAVICLPVLAATCLPFALRDAGGVKMLAFGLAKNDGREAVQETDLRLSLWHQAIGRSIHSWLLGLGPGPHLRIPVSIIAGRDREEARYGVNTHPAQTMAANFEAHNTPLDLLTQGGALATASFLWLLWTSCFGALRARHAGLSALICGGALFSMTGLIVRQPLFWFAVAICLANGSWATRRLGKRAVGGAPGRAAVRRLAGSR